MSDNIKTIAETMLWEAERRIADEGKSYQNLPSAIHTILMEVGLELNEKLRELKLELKRHQNEKGT
jgi:hypothetical protein